MQAYSVRSNLIETFRYMQMSRYRNRPLVARIFELESERLGKEATRTDVAEAIDCSVSFLDNVISYNRHFGLSTIVKIAERYEIDCNEWMEIVKADLKKTGRY